MIVEIDHQGHVVVLIVQETVQMVEAGDASRPDAREGEKESPKFSVLCVFFAILDVDSQLVFSLLMLTNCPLGHSISQVSLANSWICSVKICEDIFPSSSFLLSG